MTLAISKAVEEGAKAVVCASTGNTSASAAAYAAKAGHHLRGPGARRARSRSARWRRRWCTARACWRSRATSTPRWSWRKELAERYPVTFVNSVNPFRLEGQKTAAFEICRRPRPGARHPLRAGRQRRQHLQPLDGLLRVPRATGSSPSHRSCSGSRRTGAAPIVRGEPVKDPQTIATAIRIGNPASWDKAVAAATESEGQILAVTDREILAAYRRVAREGLFAEPASAASVAGLLQLRRRRDAPAGRHRRLRADRPWAEGPRVGHRGRRRNLPACRPIPRPSPRSSACDAVKLTRTGARHVGQPRSGVRLLRPGARPLERGRGRHGRRRRASRWEGEGADELPIDGTDMVSKAMLHAARRRAARSCPRSRCTASTGSRWNAGSDRRPRRASRASSLADRLLDLGLGA